MQSSTIQLAALALIYDITVPVQAEAIQGTQDAGSAAGDNAGGVEILDADEPTAAVMPRVEEASDRRQK
jgi:hypothetical protein